MNNNIYEAMCSFMVIQLHSCTKQEWLVVIVHIHVHVLVLIQAVLLLGDPGNLGKKLLEGHSVIV